VRIALVLLLAIAALALPAAAADNLPDYAVGAKEVLQTHPQPAAPDSAMKLKQILAQPEYQAQPPAITKSLLQRIIDWISKHFPIFGLRAAGSTAMVIAMLVAVVLLTLLVYFIVRTLWSRLSAGRAGGASTDAPQRPADWIALADEAAARGDYRGALRLRFRAVVAVMDVLDAELQTNWQLLRHVRREHPEAYKSFARLVQLYEDCWYGGLAAGRAEFDAGIKLALEVESRVVVRAEAA